MALQEYFFRGLDGFIARAHFEYAFNVLTVVQVPVMPLALSLPDVVRIGAGHLREVVRVVVHTLRLFMVRAKLIDPSLGPAGSRATLDILTTIG